MAEFVKTKKGSNRIRCERAVLDKEYDRIRDLQLIETRAEHFLKVLESGKVSTNNYLRCLQFRRGHGWLPWPVMPKKQWPGFGTKPKRAITHEEHELVLNRARDPEMKGFLWCCWHLGGSQSELARGSRRRMWIGETWRVSFFRSKSGKPQIIRFGNAFAGNFAAAPEKRIDVSEIGGDG